MLLLASYSNSVVVLMMLMGCSWIGWVMLVVLFNLEFFVDNEIKKSLKRNQKDEKVSIQAKKHRQKGTFCRCYSIYRYCKKILLLLLSLNKVTITSLIDLGAMYV